MSLKPQTTVRISQRHPHLSGRIGEISYYQTPGSSFVRLSRLTEGHPVITVGALVPNEWLTEVTE